MDWPNEFWRKFYTRRTDEDLLLSWDARAVWHEMLRTFDDAGLIKTRRGAQGLAALIRGPVDVVERSLVELTECGRVIRTEDGFFAPNFAAAQSSHSSDSLRQKARRERQRISKQDHISVTHGHALSRDVTDCHVQKERKTERQTERAHARVDFYVSGHATSRDVTDGHALSRDVTDGHALSRNVTQSSDKLQFESRRRRPEDPSVFDYFDGAGRYLRSVRMESDGTETEVPA